MKLYGLAIALIPEQNGEVLKLFCTPIAVDSDNIGEIKVLDELAFISKINNHDTSDVIKNFERVVSVLGDLVEKQKAACRDNNINYRPVSLFVGQDGRKPIDLDQIYLHLTGKPLKPHILLREFEDGIGLNRAQL